MRYFLIVLIGLLCLTPPSLAQETSSTTQQRSAAPNDPFALLSFPLTADKIRAFDTAAKRIRKVNETWDGLIAGARTDSLAVEYSEEAQQELSKALGNLDDISEAEYREIYRLSLENKEFAGMLEAIVEALKTAPQAIEAEAATTTPAPVPDAASPQ